MVLLDEADNMTNAAQVCGICMYIGVCTYMNVCVCVCVYTFIYYTYDFRERLQDGAAG